MRGARWTVLISAYFNIRRTLLHAAGTNATLDTAVAWHNQLHTGLDTRERNNIVYYVEGRDTGNFSRSARSGQTSPVSNAETVEKAELFGVSSELCVEHIAERHGCDGKVF